MGLNLDKPERWKADAAASVDFYNDYLYLYPFPQLGLTHHPDVNRLREIFDALRAIPLLDMLRAGRTYGGGLHKVEPKELTAITLPDFPTWATTSVSRQPMLV